MSTNSPNNPFSREGAESLAHTVRQAQRAMEEHPLSAVHINQGSADAMADAYDAEYQASPAMTTPPNAPEVDVLAVLDKQIRDAEERGNMIRSDELQSIRTAVAALLTREAALVAEVESLRSILSKCAAAIGNGASAAPDCSLEFLSGIPEEIALSVGKLREDAERWRYVRQNLEVTRNAAVPSRVSMEHLLVDGIEYDFSPDDDLRFIDAAIDAARAEAGA